MKIIGRYIVLILFANFSLIQKAIASPQLPDYIVFEGDTISCYTLLVEAYLNQKNIEDEGKLFDLSFRKGASLNCWRGYQAIYLIEENTLYLTDIINCGELFNGKAIDKVSSLKKMIEIFGDQVVDKRVKINWYSGTVSIPKGETLRWDGVFYKIYMVETLFTVNSGAIKDIRKVVNYENVSNGIDRVQKDSLSSILFTEILKQKWKSKFDCSERYRITINEKGKIDKIIMVDYQTQTEVEEFWEIKEYDYCIKNLKKAFSDLKFDVIKDKGIPIAEDVYLEIWFEDDGTIENWTY